MRKRLTRVLLAFVVALAAAIPVGARAMPMPSDAVGTALLQHCLGCPQHPGTGSNPDKMPACQILACADAVATLPAPVLLAKRVPLRAAYSAAPPMRWTGSAPAPDPTPPRPIVLD